MLLKVRSGPLNLEKVTLKGSLNLSNHRLHHKNQLVQKILEF